MPAKLAPERQRGLIIATGDLPADDRGLHLMGRLLALIEPQPRVTLIGAIDSGDDNDNDSGLEAMLYSAGAGDVRCHWLRSRGDTNQRALLDRVDQSHLTLLISDQPLRLSTIIGGTPLAQALRRQNAQGMAIAGCGSGAALLCEHMLMHGTQGATPHVGSANLAPGLGITNRVLIDQGGHASDRLGRLLAALALNPFALGLGLDIATAAVIGPDNVLEVVGGGGVTVIDPAEMNDSNVVDLAPGAPIRITNLRLHALTGGARYDLDFRRTVG